MKKFFEEFKNFIAKGNVIDMAVAVIIGGAFNKIITSLVNDIIMPAISMLMGGLDVTEWKYVISPAVIDATGVEVTAESAIRYGLFIQTVIDFLIVAFSIFVALKVILTFQTKFKETADKLKKKEEEQVVEELVEEPAAPEITAEQALLTEIRDLLKEQSAK